MHKCKIHKEILSPSSNIINKSGFHLMIYPAVINLMLCAKYKRFVYLREIKKIRFFL